jgi:ribosome modulation factor
MDDIYLRSPYWAALLLSTGAGFQNVWMTGDPTQGRNWIGGWRLGPMDREFIGDFNGDGCADIFIRSPFWAGLLIASGAGFENVWMSGDTAQGQNWIGGWRLGPHDRIHVGDFNGDGKADIFIRSPRWAGLLMSTGSAFQNVWMTGDPALNEDWIGGWHLGSRDREVVGDFNGDGKAEIFIRSNEWAGILASSGDGMNATFVQQDRINSWELTSADRELVGRLSGTARDEIFVYHPIGWTGVLTPILGKMSGQLSLVLTVAQFRQLTPQ